MVKLYKRPMCKEKAQFLIWLVQTYEREVARYGRSARDLDIWIDIQHAPLRGGEYAKVHHWGLADKHPGATLGVSRGNGLWRPTAKGIDFVYDRVTVPSHIYLFDNNLENVTAEQISIRQALGPKIDYDHLIHTPPPQRLAAPTEMIKA
jgi:hypothetical protein